MRKNTHRSEKKKHYNNTNLRNENHPLLERIGAFFLVHFRNDLIPFLLGLNHFLSGPKQTLRCLWQRQGCFF